MMACGEKPVVECEDSAKAAPWKGMLVPRTALTVAETFLASLVHLYDDGGAQNDT